MVILIWSCFSIGLLPSLLPSHFLTNIEVEKISTQFPGSMCNASRVSPVAEEVDEENWEEEGDEKGEEEEEGGLNGPECLRRDGEHKQEESPEESIDRVADEVDEKRLEKMQVLEKPEVQKVSVS